MLQHYNNGLSGHNVTYSAQVIVTVTGILGVIKLFPAVIVRAMAISQNKWEEQSNSKADGEEG